jgi:hypothetical protein
MRLGRPWLLCALGAWTSASACRSTRVLASLMPATNRERRLLYERLARVGIACGALVLLVGAAGIIAVTVPGQLVLLIILIGVALVGWAYWINRPYQGARTWQRAEATLLEVGELARQVQMRYSYITHVFPSVSFRYEVYGVHYLGSAASFENENIWVPEYDRKTALWAEWAPGMTVPAYYNPSKPAQAVLIRELSRERRSHHAALFVAGILVAASGVFLALRAGV